MTVKITGKPGVDWYKVNEIFVSVQGEGYWQGTPATFIRLQGCTVGCPWCDTKYTWKRGGTRMVIPEIQARVNTRHVVITGGEPTIWDLDSLISWCDATGRYVQVESSGQQDFIGFARPHWLTWSPKPNLNYLAPSERWLHEVNEIKWVVDEEFQHNLGYTLKLWEHLKSRRLEPVFTFMPEGTPPKPHLEKATFEWVVQNGEKKNWRYSDRLHTRLGVQ